jgi:hypothetical protein
MDGRRFLGGAMRFPKMKTWQKVARGAALVIWSVPVFMFIWFPRGLEIENFIYQRKLDKNT